MHVTEGEHADEGESGGGGAAPAASGLTQRITGMGGSVAAQVPAVNPSDMVADDKSHLWND
jgi:hypothetical protein